MHLLCSEDVHADCCLFKTKGETIYLIVLGMTLNSVLTPGYDFKLIHCLEYDVELIRCCCSWFKLFALSGV